MVQNGKLKIALVEAIGEKFIYVRNQTSKIITGSKRV